MSNQYILPTLLFLGNAVLFWIWCGVIYRRWAGQECPLCGRKD